MPSIWAASNILPNALQVACVCVLVKPDGHHTRTQRYTPHARACYMGPDASDGRVPIKASRLEPLSDALDRQLPKGLPLRRGFGRRTATAVWSQQIISTGASCGRGDEEQPQRHLHRRICDMHSSRCMFHCRWVKLFAKTHRNRGHAFLIGTPPEERTAVCGELR